MRVKQLDEKQVRLERRQRKMENSKIRLAKRHLKIRHVVKGTSIRPRLVVFRSNAHIYGMLVDDSNGKTLVSAGDKTITKKDMTKVEKAKEVGKLVAEKALKEKIKTIVFDRSGYLYHGRVKALADGAREGGLKF